MNKQKKYISVVILLATLCMGIVLGNINFNENIPGVNSVDTLKNNAVTSDLVSSVFTANDLTTGLQIQPIATSEDAQVSTNFSLEDNDSNQFIPTNLRYYVALDDEISLLQANSSVMEQEIISENDTLTAMAINQEEETEAVASKGKNIKETKESKEETKEKTTDKEDEEEESLISFSIASKTSKYNNIGISTADSYVNIRKEPSTDSEILGKLYKNSAAEILDTTKDWYYIRSGSVKGYINKDYLKTDFSDDQLIESYGTVSVLVNTDGLNVRSKKNTESNRLTVIYQNETYEALDVGKVWVKVNVADDKVTGYVKREYVNIIVRFEEAISTEEEKLQKLMEEAAKAAKQSSTGSSTGSSKGTSTGTSTVNRSETSYTAEELKLLACLVHSEAGNQSYEGKLAVANVVINRMKSSKFPSTIKGVIYQSGQFSVASSGALQKQLDQYSNYYSNSQKLSIQAAKAALEGTNNIGSKLYFNRYETAVKHGKNTASSVRIQDHLFW